MITDPITAERSSPPDAEPVASKIADVGSGAAGIEQHARALIRQRPVVAVLAAVGVGYVVARLVARALR